MRGMNALQRRRYKRAAPKGAATVYADARTAGRSRLTLNNTDPVEAMTAIHSAKCTARSWSDSVVASSTPTAAAGYQDTGWRNFFVDPQVAGLITEALKNNRDLKMAALKVEEARAQFNVTDADRYPQLNASSGITYSGGLKSDKPTAQQYDAGLALSYELDFFGKLKNMSEADRQNYFASEEARRAVHILLVSNVSQSYFNQQLAYKQLRIARDTLNNYRQSYAFVEQQLVTGSTNVLALEQARGQIESTQAEIAKREGELAQANNALQLVLGTYRALPGDGGMNASDVAPVKLPPHLSSAILLQRPDIMEAEYQLKAADANIGAARAAFFPTISLTSGLSTGSTELSSLFTSGSGMWNFIPKFDIVDSICQCNTPFNYLFRCFELQCLSRSVV